jgi:hypothetical protein
MKRLFIVLAGAFLMLGANAQIVKEDEAALVYYSPKTIIVLDFTYSIERQEAGMFAPYAEEMLGVKDVISENRTRYVLEDAVIGTRTEADYTRPHKIVLEKGSETPLLNLNEKNLLVGYNMPPAKKEKGANKPTGIQRNVQKSKDTGKTIAPYSEEILEAKSLKAKAEAVAKQIYHLRETRMYLLGGEVEHAPADGKAMDLVLTELNRQEKALTELFVGKRSKEILHKRMDYREIEVDRQNETTRCQAKKYVYPLFFSTENGFTNAENVDADSILTCVQLQIPPYHKTISKKDKKKKYDVSEIVYNLPGYCDVNVVYKGQTLSERTIPLAQSGMDVPLPKELFSGSELPSIVFSEKTGNIISISK